MRPILLLTLLASLLLAPGVALAQKDEPVELPDYGQKVGAQPEALDPYLDKILSNIALFQEAFEKQYGTYAQTVEPHSKETIPADGFALYPEPGLETKYPTGGITVTDFYTAAGLTAFPASVRIDVYDGPNGKGYVLIALTKFDGRLWIRAINTGPETTRTTNWQQVTDP